jgi:glycosyltransferase involved in cell wall biosynthesis
LIEALPPDIPLEVVGPSSDAAYLDLVKQLAYLKKVAFSGHRSDGDLVETYRRSRRIVLPSLYRRYGNETKVPELLGQTLLEGMACGIPAICTNVAAIPGAVVDGVTGFIVPPDDLAAMRTALLTLCTDTARAGAMGAAARARMLEHFQWSSVVKRCLEAYRA